jgi:hypothetical protein
MTDAVHDPAQSWNALTIGDVGRHRWEILDSEGLLQTSAGSFATEREAKDNGRLEMQRLVEMWKKK